MKTVETKKWSSKLRTTKRVRVPMKKHLSIFKKYIINITFFFFLYFYFYYYLYKFEELYIFNVYKFIYI